MSRDLIQLMLNEEMRLRLKKVRESLWQLMNLRTLPNKPEVRKTAPELCIMLNHLGKLAIYLDYIIREALEQNQLPRHVMVAVCQAEAKLIDEMGGFYGKPREAS